jgi:hypothetical protein
LPPQTTQRQPVILMIADFSSNLAQRYLPKRLKAMPAAAL